MAWEGGVEPGGGGLEYDVCGGKYPLSSQVKIVNVYILHLVLNIYQ